VVAAFAGGMVLLSGAPDVWAAPQTAALIQQPAPAVHSAKGDRLVMLKGAACSTLGWPNYEDICRFDARQPADERRTIRVIALR
jgi:hypothetical protein